MFFTGILAGQPIISARSGVLVYLEGEVLIAGKPRDPARHEFRDIQEGKELRTGKGRAEILLGPDAFLRVDEDSSVKMISNDLTGPRAEILAGRAILELIKPRKQNDRLDRG